MSGFALLIAIVIASYLIKNFIWNSQWETTSPIDSGRRYFSIAFFYSIVIKSIETIFVSKSLDIALAKSAIGIFIISILGFVVGLLIFRFSNNNSENQDNEDYWSVALNEIESNNKDSNIWAKSLAEANGDNEKAAAVYLKKRVKYLKNMAK
jgi:hypothetical protein